MIDNSQIPLQAFVEQISNWQMTLQRETKKLKQLRKVSSNKFQINSIEITLIGIESQLIQYRKIKDKVKIKLMQRYSESQDIIEDYTQLSKRFMHLMEKIADAAEQDKYKDTIILDSEQDKVQQNYCPNKKKHFLQETFTHKISKEAPRKKNQSCIVTKKDMSILLKDKSKVKEAVKGLNNKQWNSKINSRHTHIHKLQKEEQQDLSDIRYQLKEIKSMMLQIENEIKFHSHEDIEKEVSKLSHANKKISMDIKNIKDDNQFMLARLNNIKDEINHEKKAQAEMIKQFQMGKQNKGLVSELSKSKNIAQEISEWVKVRI